MDEVMILTGSDILKEFVISGDSHRWGSAVTVHVGSERPLLPVLWDRDVRSDSTRSRVQIINHWTVVIWAIIIVVLVKGWFWTSPMNELGNLLLLGCQSSIACSRVITHFISVIRFGLGSWLRIETEGPVRFKSQIWRKVFLPTNQQLSSFSHTRKKSLYSFLITTGSTKKLQIYVVFECIVKLSVFRFC